MEFKSVLPAFILQVAGKFVYWLYDGFQAWRAPSKVETQLCELLKLGNGASFDQFRDFNNEVSSLVELGEYYLPKVAKTMSGKRHRNYIKLVRICRALQEEVGDSIERGVAAVRSGEIAASTFLKETSKVDFAIRDAKARLQFWRGDDRTSIPYPDTPADRARRFWPNMPTS